MSISSVDNAQATAHASAQPKNNDDAAKRQTASQQPPPAAGNYGAKSSKSQGNPFNAVIDLLEQLGVDNQTIEQVTKMIADVVNKGIDPRKLAAAMTQTAQDTIKKNGADPKAVLQALVQLLKAADSQVASAKLKSVGDFLKNDLGTMGAGVDDNTLGKLQSNVDQLLKAGANPHALADGMIKIIQNAQKQNVKDPKQIVGAISQMLQGAAQGIQQSQNGKKSGQSGGAEKQLQAVFAYLKDLGVDDKTLQALAKMVNDLAKAGANPEQIAQNLVAVAKQAQEKNVKDPKQVVDAMAQTLQKLAQGGQKSAQNDQKSSQGTGAEKQLQAVFAYLKDLGVDDKTLQALAKMVNDLAKAGANPEQIAQNLVAVAKQAQEKNVNDPKQVVDAMAQTLQKLAQGGQEGQGAKASAAA